MIKTIMFDLDGVLVDAREWHYKALNKALMDTCGTEITRQEHETTYDGLNTKTKLTMLAATNRVPRDKFDVVFALKQHYTFMFVHDYCRPVEQKIEMMRKLHGYQLACVTNSIAKTAYEMLVLSGLNYYMDYVQGNEAVRFNKPNPAPYLHAMSVLGVAPDSVLIVEDSEHGLAAATSSGAKVFKVTYETCNYETIIGGLQ